jgi:hypothetical protein
MKTIWKYELTGKDINRYSIPENYKFLSVERQHGRPVVYFLVDPDSSHLDVTFTVIGTGFDLEEDFVYENKYLGTFMTEDEHWVWHVFMTKE